MRASSTYQTFLSLVVVCRRVLADTVTVDVSTFAELKDAVTQDTNDSVTHTRVNVLSSLLWEEEVVVAGGRSVDLVGQRGAVLLNASASLSRHLRIDLGGTLSLQNLLFTGGRLASGDFGGVIYNAGVVEMRWCSFFRNEAGAGGVVYNEGTMRQVEHCSFEDNQATIRGGVVYNKGAITEIKSSSFARNSAIWGGAIRNDGVIGAMDLCEFHENVASFGGAFFQGSFSQPVFFVGTAFAGDDPSDICVEGNGNVRLHNTSLSPLLRDPIEGRASGCLDSDSDPTLGMVFDLEAWETEREFRCKLCPPGAYMNREVDATTNNVLTSCFPCPPGTANDAQGQESCEVCLSSLHLVPSTNATACECAEGWTMDTAGRQCTCPAGHYQEFTSCVPCEPGTFKETLGTEEALCTAEDTTWVVGLAAGGAVVGAVLLVCLSCLGARKVRTYCRLQSESRHRTKATVLKAVHTTQQLDYPVTLVWAPDFCAAGTLLPHERLRDQGKLTVFDSFEEASFLRYGHPIVFFSHQWTAFDEPDHTNKHFELMKRSLAQVCTVKGWMLEDVFVWVDFCSIPQTLPTLQSLAINSLAAYASIAQAFVVIAPEVQHSDLSMVCDEASYRSRMWCRAEQFAHVVRNGSENMWLATDDTGVVPIELDWLEGSAFDVFGGELTCCRLRHRGRKRCDRESLVIPILGLYGELYASKHTACVQRPAAKLILDKVVAEGLGAVFPKDFDFVSDDPQSTSGTRRLFGHLVQEMEHQVDSDEGIRRQYIHQETKEHAATVADGPITWFL